MLIITCGITEQTICLQMTQLLIDCHTREKDFNRELQRAKNQLKTSMFMNLVRSSVNKGVI